MPSPSRIRTASPSGTGVISTPIAEVAEMAIYDFVLCDSPGVARLAVEARRQMTDAQAVAAADEIMTATSVSQRHHAALFVALPGSGTPDDQAVSAFLKAVMKVGEKGHLSSEARSGFAAASFYRPGERGEELSYSLSSLLECHVPGIDACLVAVPPPVAGGGLAMGWAASEKLRAQVAADAGSLAQVSTSLTQVPFGVWSDAFDRALGEHQAPHFAVPRSKVDDALYVLAHEGRSYEVLQAAVLRTRATMTDADAMTVADQANKRLLDTAEYRDRRTEVLSEFIMAEGATAVRDRGVLSSAMRRYGVDDGSHFLTDIALVTAVGIPVDDRDLARRGGFLSKPMVANLIERAVQGRLGGAALVGAIDQAAHGSGDDTFFAAAARRIPAMGEWIDTYVAGEGKNWARLCERALTADIPIDDATLGKTLLTGGHNSGWRAATSSVAEHLAKRGGIAWSKSLSDLISDKGIIVAAEKNSKALQILQQLSATGKEPIITQLVSELTNEKLMERASRILASLGDAQSTKVYDSELAAAKARIAALENEVASMRRGKV